MIRVFAKTATTELNLEIFGQRKTRDKGGKKEKKCFISIERSELLM